MLTVIDKKSSKLLQAATAGEAIKRGEIEPAVERSAATAWKHDDGASLREALKTCGSIVQSPDAPAGFTVHQSEKHNATQVTSRANGAKGGRRKNPQVNPSKTHGLKPTDTNTSSFVTFDRLCRESFFFTFLRNSSLHPDSPLPSDSAVMPARSLYLPLSFVKNLERPANGGIFQALLRSRQRHRPR
jgi:hypothetical protein